MPRWKHSANLVAVDIHHLHALFGDWKLRQSEIGDVFHYGFHDASAIGTVHLQLNRGKLLLVFRENPWEDINTGRLVRGDDQFSPRHNLELVNCVLWLTAPFHKLLR